ncbi:MAG: hypothetical protein RL398_165 [Planctomycetota bacterium]
MVLACATVALGSGACDRHQGPTEAMVQRLLAQATPDTWQDLDPAVPGRRKRDPRSGVVFVKVAGEHPLWLAESELTVAQWRSYVAEFAGHELPLPADDSLPAPASFDDAREYCLRFGYRLPTEAEWEAACRAGLEDAAAPWRDPQSLAAHAWFHQTAGDAPHAVMTRTANPWGLYDMLGNVWEWCDAEVGTDRVLRGGSWFTNPAPNPKLRTQAAGESRNSFYGFRPARDL